VPVREHFAQPVRGDAAQPADRPRVVLDDNLPWENGAEPDEEDDQ
jgi:hypothetical protein